MTDNFISLEEATKHVGKSRRTILYWLEDDCIINYVPGSVGRRMRFDKTELEAASNVQGNSEEKEKLRKAIKDKLKSLNLKTPSESIAA